MTSLPIPVDVSVLVPDKDEAENLPEFLRQCDAALGPAGFSFEVVVVNDGSRDDTPTVLAELAGRYPFLRVVHHRRQRGIADALRSAGDAARGDVFVFYPADLQYLPADIPALVAPILEGRADIVTGTKQGKYEKAFVSGVYNRLCRLLFGVQAQDLNSVKAYRREVMRRPDLAIYMDDPESPETADTFLKRQRHKRWFGGTFMGLGGSEWDIFVIGNLPHHDCLIAGLVKDKTWDGKLWRAENIPPRDNERYPAGNTKTDGSALWPEVWGLVKLESYRNEPEVSALGYAREMMNDPREEENKAFSLDEFELFDYEEEKPTYVETVISIDPAGGENPGEVRRGKRDYCAIVAMGRRKDNSIDVFDACLKKVLPDDQIDLALDMYTYHGGYIFVEEDMYKNLLKSAMDRRAKERGLYPSVKVRTSAQNKITRILSLQPPSRQRIMRFNKSLIDTVPELFAQTGPWDRTSSTNVHSMDNV